MERAARHPIRATRLRVERETERRSSELRAAARTQAARATEAARLARAAASNTNQPPGARIVRHADQAPPAAPRELKTGDRVRLRTLGTTGVIERINGSDVELLVGSLRLREKLANLELIDDAPAPRAPEERGARLRRQAAQRGTQVTLRPTADEATAELKLIGRTTDEALDLTDKFLDEAYVQNLNPIRIVHGVGTGAVRRVVTELLRNHPHVARYQLAPREQGGEGATIVELKQ